MPSSACFTSVALANVHADNKAAVRSVGGPLTDCASSRRATATPARLMSDGWIKARGLLWRTNARGTVALARMAPSGPARNNCIGRACPPTSWPRYGQDRDVEGHASAYFLPARVETHEITP